jgi:hypothetical protein
MLSWREQGGFALVGDPKTPVFVQSPISPPESSVQARTLQFKLSSDGTLEGDVKEYYTGHQAEDRRSEIFGKSDPEIEGWLKERVLKTFPNSVITDMKVENANDATQPLEWSYHVSSPYFAEIIGKRLLIQPIVFARGTPAVFTASERYTPIHFPYAIKETDHIRIKLPAGFSFDNAQAPGSLSFGPPGWYSIQVTVEGDQLVISRELVFGAGGTLFFDLGSYPTIKKVFDEIHTRDLFTLVMKED